MMLMLMHLSCVIA